MILATQQVPAFNVEAWPAWLNGLLTIVVTVVIPIVVTYLKKYLSIKVAESKEQLKQVSNNRLKLLEERVKQYALMRASSFVERDFFDIAKEIVDGLNEGKDKDEIAKAAKDKLKALGKTLLEEIKEKFAKESIDIVQELGEEQIDRIIEWAANKVSPFPGKPTVKAMLEGGAKKMLEIGIEDVKKELLD